jgi:hypothetical protein
MLKICLMGASSANVWEQTRCECGDSEGRMRQRVRGITCQSLAQKEAKIKSPMKAPPGAKPAVSYSAQVPAPAPD